MKIASRGRPGSTARLRDRSPRRPGGVGLMLPRPRKDTADSVRMPAATGAPPSRTATWRWEDVPKIVRRAVKPSARDAITNSWSRRRMNSRYGARHARPAFRRRSRWRTSADPGRREGEGQQDQKSAGIAWRISMPRMIRCRRARRRPAMEPITTPMISGAPRGCPRRGSCGAPEHARESRRPSRARGARDVQRQPAARISTGFDSAVTPVTSSS